MNRKQFGSGRRRWLSSTTAIVGAVPALALSASIAYANPQGGTVTQGSATITQTTPKTLTINQSSDKAVINWQSFSIGQGETTRFNQPSASAVTLNRVTGSQVSQILGTLSANGRIFLVNPNGILFGNGAQIDVAALTATTHGITDQNFMAGNFRFDIPGKPNAQIINLGTITAADGGLVALVAPSVRNSGIIQARLGRVALAGANGFTLDLYGDNLILFQASDQIVKQITDASGTPVASLVQNDGKVYADGGTVLMTADVAKGVVDSAVNMTGLVSAKTVAKQNGDIILDGGNSGVQVAGTLDASGQASGQTGGQVTVNGGTIALASASKLDASGDAGGGKVTVGSWQATSATMADGAAIDASAKTTGNGGAVSVISDTTNVAGTILAKGGQNGGDGGQVETSGHTLRVGSITVNTLAFKGRSGSWLLDPWDLTIDSTAAASIDTALATGGVTIQTQAGNATNAYGVSLNPNGNGDITVNSAISWNANTTLTLDAYRYALINANITATGNSAGFNILYNDGGSGGNFQTGQNASVSLTGTNPSLEINNTQYTLISNAADLQRVSMSGHYALNADFSLGSWTPLGYVSSGNNMSPNQFTGVLDGQGHTLSNLSINDSSDGSLGLISSIGSSGVVRNIKLKDATLTAGVVNNNSNGIGWFGPLAGVNYGTIYNASSTNGTIVGASNNTGFGGLVGWSQGTITDSFSTGTMTLGSTTLWSGGLLGYNAHNGGVISSSYSSVNISAGGGSGLNGNGGTRIGGLAGENSGVITDSYATGSVSGGGGSGGIGGLVGLNNYSMSNVYATGAVSGGWGVGVLVGWVGSYYGYGTATASNSFCNTDSAPYSCGQGTGLNTAGMQTASNFLNTNPAWSTSTWTLVDGSYPKLAWTVATTSSSSSSASSSSSSSSSSTTTPSQGISTGTPGNSTNTNTSGQNGSIINPPGQSGSSQPGAGNNNNVPINNDIAQLYDTVSTPYKFVDIATKYGQDGLAAASNAIADAAAIYANVSSTNTTSFLGHPYGPAQIPILDADMMRTAIFSGIDPAHTSPSTYVNNILSGNTGDDAVKQVVDKLNGLSQESIVNNMVAVNTVINNSLELKQLYDHISGVLNLPTNINDLQDYIVHMDYSSVKSVMASIKSSWETVPEVSKVAADLVKIFSTANVLNSNENFNIYQTQLTINTLVAACGCDVSKNKSFMNQVIDVPNDNRSSIFSPDTIQMSIGDAVKHNFIEIPSV